MIVRSAEPRDIPEIVSLGQTFSKSDVYRAHIRLDAERFVESLSRMIAAPDAVVFVLESSGKAVGSIGGFASPGLFNHERHAVEAFWFVDAEFRGNGGGRKLFDAIIAWAKSLNVVSLNMIEPPGTPEVGALYARNGFVKFETYWNLPCL